MSVLGQTATPEERAEAAAHIQADLEAGRYELDEKTAAWFERVR